MSVLSVPLFKIIPRFPATNMLRCTHIINHLVFIYALSIGTWKLWLGAYLWWQVLGLVGISIGFHRLLSHNSFKTYLWFEKLTVFLGCLATGGSPIGWVGIHRMHHVESDSEQDPHSPCSIGFWNSYFHNWKNTKIPRRFVRDLFAKDYLKWLHRNYFLILSLWIVGLYLIDYRLGIFGYSVPAVFAFHGYSSINAMSHKVGYRNFNVSDRSTNNPFAFFLTGGECWHNNHHKYPNRHRFSCKWWEMDPSARLIEIIHFENVSRK